MIDPHPQRLLKRPRPGHHPGRGLLPGRPRPDGLCGAEQRGPRHAARWAQGLRGERQGAADPLEQSPDSAGHHQFRWEMRIVREKPSFTGIL